jgi:hypothetical protein
MEATGAYKKKRKKENFKFQSYSCKKGKEKKKKGGEVFGVFFFLLRKKKKDRKI